MATTFDTGLSFPKDTPLPPIGSSSHNTKLSNATQFEYHGILPSGQQQMVTSIVDDGTFSTKLTNVEAQRIMSVLQEAQKKVLLIGFLPDTVDRKVSTVLGNEAVALITVSTSSK
jgi:hypothetical protein